MPPRPLLATALVAVALALLAAAPAGATTFGADLSQPVTGTGTCGNSFFQNSCLGYAVSPTSYAPASGTVSTVRVKTGDFQQGPMQVVVLRSYYQNNPPDPGHPNFFCCFLQEYGPTFVPARNAITTVPVTLGMVEDPTPPPSDGNTVAKGDFLALSVLDGTTPVPLNTSGGLTGYYAPAPQSPNNPPAPSPNALAGSQGAFQGTLMMNADLDPLSGGGGGGGAPGGGPPGGGAPGGGPGNPLTPAQPVTIDPGAGRLLGSTAAIPLVCRLTTACTGMLALRDAPLAGVAAAKHKKKKARGPRLLGSKSFSIAAGKTATVKVALNAAGRSFVRNKKKAVLYGTATVGGRAITVKLTLTATKKH